MILAAPLVIPFAKALGLSVGVLGVAALSDKVNQFIQDNPEESMKILSTIIPGAGIGQIFMNKEEKISLEDLDGMSDEEAQDLSKEDKAELMKQAGKSGSKDKRQIMIDISEKLGLSGEGKDKQDIEYEIDERYDEGGVEEVSKPKFDYKKFFRNRKADGGSIGIEVLFEPKRKNFNTGGRATTQDFANALKSVSAGTTYQQQRQAKDYARQEASNLLSQAMRSGNQGNIQSILQGIGGIASMGGMQFNRSGNRITSVPATGPGRDAIINAMANKMLNTTSYGTISGGSSAPMKKSPLQLKIEENQRIYDEYVKNNPPAIGIISGPTGQAPTAPPPPEYEDQALLSKLTMLTPEEAFAGETFDTLSDLDQYNFAQAFTQFQPQLRDPTYVSPYGALSGRDIFARRYGIKDGGRVGLFMGGDPLTGQALSIYDSMKAYDFTDQQIADALAAQGLYTPSGSSTPETTAPNIIGAQLNQGDDRVTELQETFTKDLSEDPRFNYLEPTAQANKYRFDRSVEPRDGLMGFFDKVGNKFKESKFFQPKIKGTLGTRLANQPKLPIPSFASFLSNYTSPFNMQSKNYNPLLEAQLNFAETKDGIIGRDPNSGLLKYGPESVLSGKNVISMFGTNDYEQALMDYITKMNAYQNKKATDARAIKIAKAEAELKELQEKTEAARAAQYGQTDYGRGSDGQRSYSGDALGDKDLGFGIGATTGGPVSNRTGRGRQDYSKGGLVTMFKEKR